MSQTMTSGFAAPSSARSAFPLAPVLRGEGRGEGRALDGKMAPHPSPLPGVPGRGNHRNVRVLAKSRRSSAFTLIELLVVIGIIVVLIAILLPVVNSVRKAANVTATKNQMHTISSAIQAYYTDYHSYPGPFSEDQIDTNSATSWQLGNSGPPLMNSSGGNMANITSTENLVLGLSGGLSVTFTNTGIANGFQYSGANVNSGPQVLNTLIAAQKQTTAYYTPTPAELAPSDGAGGYQAFNTGSATDSVIPEYYDHIPGGIITTNVTPNANDQYGPILYMRARVSAVSPVNEPGVSYSPASTPPLPAAVPQGQPATGFQYNVYQLAPYGFLWNSVSATDFPAPVNNPAGNPPTYNPYPGSTVVYDPVTVYFANAAIAGQPKGKDAFILISAGTDRIFGTKDDIIYGN
jgi:type II secretory pathway pseudopilin PulG